jgi:hypothetical protein
VNTILKTFLLAGTLAGCLASGRVGYQATVVAPAPAVVVEAPPPPPPQPAPAVYVEAQPAVEVAYVEPTAFVYVSPEVQVIEDYDYPVFFYGGMYWRNEGGLWYSSSYHDRGWLTVSTPPVYVTRINNPTQYVHYRANVNARPGQIGYRAAVTAPIHHSAPPPRFVEHPGHPVAPPHPVMEGNAGVHAGPPGPPVGHEPPGHMGEPPGHMGPPGHPAEPPHEHPMEHGGPPMVAPGHAAAPPPPPPPHPVPATPHAAPPPPPPPPHADPHKKK